MWLVYRLRADSGERHPGHFDRERGGLDVESVREQSEPLPIGGKVIEVDTTSFEAVDVTALCARIAAAPGQWA